MPTGMAAEVLQTPSKYLSEEVSSLLPAAKSDSFLIRLTARPFSLYTIKCNTAFPQQNEFYEELTRTLRNTLKTARNRTYRVRVSLLKSQVINTESIKLLVWGRRKCLYEAFIFDVPRGQEPLSNQSTSYYFMAVMRAEYEWMSKIAFAFVERSFLCIIMPIIASNRQLNFLVGLSINESLRRGFNDGFILKYAVPGMEGASCQVSWDSQSLLNMWNLSVQLGNENMLTDEFSAKFTTAVQEHTNSVYGINLEKYTLKAASLMGLRVSQESTLALHIYSSQILFVLLNFLHVEFQNNCRLPF